ncbi:hypothetical protein [Reyranella sp.]|uniref:hypothetical protein n=1 Tax=Reyranella sp. TaxID=1929291 RepID=UPI0027316913|nr:hypothetical protein [Reyranella sp.]MDP2372480.1 hypothetical protein [Reyranella sp.]
MEGLGFAIGLGVLILVSLYAGRHWAQSTFQAALLGVGAAVAAVTVAVATSMSVLIWDPAGVDAGEVGITLVFLMAAAPLVGVASTISVHRQASREASRSREIIGARLRALGRGRQI